MRIVKILGAALAAAMLCACASGSPGEKIDVGLLGWGSAETDLEVAESSVIFSGDSADIKGEGAEFSGGVLTVTSGGSYRLSGELKGSIVVDIPKNEEAELIFSGLSIESDGSAIHVKCADKVTFTLEKDTVNSVMDGEDYCADDDAETSACIYSADDITFEGEGQLFVYAKCRNGIQTKNDLRIKGAIITVSAPKNALKGKDSVQISGGSVIVTGAKDGIKSDNETEDGRGVVTITGGNIDIYCQDDGIQAFRKIDISSATVKINSGDKSLNCDGEISVADGCLVEE